MSIITLKRVVARPNTSVPFFSELNDPTHAENNSLIKPLLDDGRMTQVETRDTENLTSTMVDTFSSLSAYCDFLNVKHKKIHGKIETHYAQHSIQFVSRDFTSTITNISCAINIGFPENAQWQGRSIAENVTDVLSMDFNYNHANLAITSTSIAYTSQFQDIETLDKSNLFSFFVSRSDFTLTLISSSDIEDLGGTVSISLTSPNE